VDIKDLQCNKLTRIGQLTCGESFGVCLAKKYRNTVIDRQQGIVTCQVFLPFHVEESIS
jgi:hypothetical protein